MRTPFSNENKGFSDKAHENAKTSVYPKMLNVDVGRISYAVQEDLLIDKAWEQLDGKMAIDRIVKLSVQGLRYPLELTVQERFRRPSALSKQDITITEYNPKSDTPSELYKIKAHYFVYGYYDEYKNQMMDCIAVNVAEMLTGIATSNLKYTTARNPTTSQPFIAITFDDLHTAGLVKWHMNRANIIKLAPAITDAQGLVWLRSLNVNRFGKMLQELGRVLDEKVNTVPTQEQEQSA
jgi:hypothetical protein